MSQNKFLEQLETYLYGDIANEETNLFNRRESWNPEDTLSDKYRELLAPHSEPYFNRLRPLFSYEIKSLQSLNLFSHVLLRDGVLFLLRFFQRFPVPEGLRTKVFIQKDLAPLIPESWREHCLLYDVKSSLNPAAYTENLLLVLNGLQEQNLYSDVKVLLEYLREELPSLKELLILPFFNIPRGEDFFNYDRSQLFGLVDFLGASFREKNKYMKVSFVNRGELNQRPQESLSFVHLNHRKLYYSDSSVDHLLLSSGQRLYGTADEHNGVQIALSPYHHMEVFPVKKQEGHSMVVWLKERGYPNKGIFKDSFTLNRDIEDFFKAFYYNKEFFHLAVEVSKRLFQNSERP